MDNGGFWRSLLFALLLFLLWIFTDGGKGCHRQIDDLGDIESVTVEIY